MSKLNGAWWKINRAFENLMYADDLCQVIRQRNACDWRVRQGYPQLGQHAVEFMGVRVVVNFDLISAVAGDAINNLRSALDYLAWELVGNTGIRSILSEKALRSISFPLHLRSDSAEQAIPVNVPGISPEIKKLIKSVQPYNTGYECLSTLADLNRIDKHRAIVTTCMAGIISEHGFIVPGGSIITSDLDPEFIAKQIWREVKAGDVVGVFEVEEGTEFNPYLVHAVDVAFSSAEVEGIKSPIVPMLNEFIKTVKGILELFEPHLSSP